MTTAAGARPAPGRQALMSTLYPVTGEWWGSKPTDTEAMERVERLCREAADIWVAHVPPPHPESGHEFTSSGNAFLWAAEKAWFEARDALPWQQRDVPATRPPGTGCYLYRLWQPDGRLLYVGVSTKLRARLRSHKRKWGDLWDRATWEEYPDLASMLDAEGEAIREENPALNRSGIR